MNELSSLLSAMVALSIGVERVVEILKGLVPKLKDAPDVVIHVLAAAIGAAVSYALGPSALVAAIPKTASPILGAALLGLMASGGSAFWNHALDIMGAVKKVKEDAATSDGKGQPGGANVPMPTHQSGA